MIGINLLREGLDLPEVSLVCIMDADKEGFLRNERSLIQTIGRAARNAEGHVILYADRVTANMQKAITETERRREKQQAYNAEHGIEPKTIVRAIENPLAELVGGDYVEIPTEKRSTRKGKNEAEDINPARIPKLVVELRKEMKRHAAKLEFERAAELRDRIKELEAMQLEIAGT